MIPKILHQIWICDKPAPTNLMKSWKDKHPDFEYIMWNETELMKRKMVLQCDKQIQQIAEINGKADIIRWEILYEYGGYFVDADSICIEPFDYLFKTATAFATYENENVRAGLVATGTMGFIPKHPLCKDIIEWIKNGTDSQQIIQENRAWFSVGPGLLTKMLKTGLYPDFTIYPSYLFLPNHFMGLKYSGHKKVYGYQEWGTSNQSYDTMNSVVLPPEFAVPKIWYSVLITSYNTAAHYVRDCLNSIRCQIGYFGIEIVWINDGSCLECSEELVEEIKQFDRSSRFTRIIYYKNETNKGTAISSNTGLSLCSSELVFKMDADDIMLPDRMIKQIDFMNAHPDAVLCGGNIQMFTSINGKKTFTQKTNHPGIMTWLELCDKRPTWYMNNSTVCYRKTAVNSVGKYRIAPHIMYMCEDFDLLARLLKKYGIVYNLPDILVLYRIHGEQLSAKAEYPSTNTIIQETIDLSTTI